MKKGVIRQRLAKQYRKIKKSMNEETQETNETAEEPQETPEQEVELTEEEQLRAEMEEWRGLAQRKAAEVENIRRRAANEREQLQQYAAESTLQKVLPLLDDLQSAVESARQSDDLDALKTGLEMIYKKTAKVFEDMGVRVIDHEPGQPFDVDLHEALMHVPNDQHPEGHIVQMVQRGYALHDKVLRHAKVITSAGADQGDN